MNKLITVFAVLAITTLRVGAWVPSCTPFLLAGPLSIDDEYAIPNPTGSITYLTPEEQKISFHCKHPEKSKISFVFYHKDSENDYLVTHLDENNQLPELDGVNIDMNKPMKIFIHGYLSSTKPPLVPKDGSFYYIAKAYKSSEQDVNLVMVDWGEYANCWKYRSVAEEFVPAVGKIIGQMLDTLMSHDKYKLNPDKIHLIGHSLGAQTAHFVVKDLNKNKKIARITGLDPARPCYPSIFTLTEGLNKNDAQFVDIIHTNSGNFGVENPKGHVDFYPNGGKFQNGCSTWWPWKDTCSHGRAVNYFAESILSKKGFYARKCTPYRYDLIEFPVDEQLILMGEKAPITADEGTYCLDTNDRYPFAMGK